MRALLWTMTLGLISLLFYSSQAASQTRVEVSLPSSQAVSLSYQQPFRFAQLLDDVSAELPAEQMAAINWSLARFSSTILQRQLEAQRRQLMDDLDGLSRHWVYQDEPQLADGISRLAAQVQRWPLQASYYLGIERDRVRLVLPLNPLLGVAGNEHYQLELYSGLPQKVEFGLRSDNPVADQSFHWRIAIDGTVIKQPVAYYNAIKPSVCYKHLVERPFELQKGDDCSINESTLHRLILIDPDYLTNEFKDVNQRLVMLAKYLAPDATGVVNE